jgi:hypothetical protein
MSVSVTPAVLPSVFLGNKQNTGGKTAGVTETGKWRRRVEETGRP